MATSTVVRSQPVRLWLGALIFAALALFVPLPAWFVDQFYSRDFYPLLQRWLTSGSNLVPFAVLDVMIVVAGYMFLSAIFRTVSVARHVGVMDAAWEAFKRLVRAAAVLTLVFMWFWGFNYRRLPLETTLVRGGLATPSVEMLQGAVADSNALATRLRSRATSVGLSLPEIARKLRDPFNTALISIGRTPLETTGRPKYSLVITPFFTWTGVDGMINPLALESIVHPDLLPFERPFVLAHEWSHLAGHADEAEANAIGWLACLKGEQTFAYSASLYLIMEARAALPPDQARAAMAALDPGVRSDLEAIADRLRQEQPMMQHAANRVYDQYLKANQIEDGTASYGRALRLILSAPIHDALSNYHIVRTD